MFTMTSDQFRMARAATKLRADDIAAEAKVDRRVVFHLEGNISPSKRPAKGMPTLPFTDEELQVEDAVKEELAAAFGPPLFRGADDLNRVIGVYNAMGITFEDSGAMGLVRVDRDVIHERWPYYYERAEARRAEEKERRDRLRAETARKKAKK